MTPPGPTLPRLVAAVAAGGALGAVARWALELLGPGTADAFPWPTFAINVVGSALLAAVALLPVARRPDVAAFLGPGVLGGFTTMSAASVETVALAEAGHPALAAAYCLGTLGAALVAVAVISRSTE